jgi:hypothetical protein
MGAMLNGDLPSRILIKQHFVAQAVLPVEKDELGIGERRQAPQTPWFWSYFVHFEDTWRRATAPIERLGEFF